jgi:hypothetical protein
MSDPRGADRRRQALSFGVTVSVAVWGAVAGIVALAQPTRWVTALLVLGALTLTLWGAVLAYRQQRREALERAAAWKATVETALPVGLGRVRDTNPYEATLVESASRAERYMRPGDLRPPYVERKQDPEIERALADPDKHVVLVQGSPRSGKGRSVFEAITRTMPGHWLVVPGGFEGLEVLRSPWPPCPPGEPVLLWLNELRDFVRPGGLPSAWLDRWAQTAHLKLVALARDGDYADLGREGEVHQGLGTPWPASTACRSRSRSGWPGATPNRSAPTSGSSTGTRR